MSSQSRSDRRFTRRDRYLGQSFSPSESSLISAFGFSNQSMSPVSRGHSTTRRSRGCDPASTGIATDSSAQFASEVLSIAAQDSERVVSLLQSCTALLFVLGLRPVGVSHGCDHPPAVTEIPTPIDRPGRFKLYLLSKGYVLQYQLTTSTGPTLALSVERSPRLTHGDCTTGWPRTASQRRPRR